MKQHNLHRLAFTLLATAAPYLAASPVEAAGLPECIGRVQAMLPGHVEVAAIAADRFVRHVAANEDPVPAFPVFPDGERAFGSRLFYRGQLRAIHMLGATDKEKLRLAVDKSMQTHIDWLRHREGLAPNASVDSERLPVTRVNGSAWRVGSRYRALFEFDNAALEWGVDAIGKINDSREDYRDIVDGVRARPLHSVPEEAGICLPYSFIRDNASAYRSVSMIYRLQDHPDVTIWIEDKSADRFEKGRNPNSLTAEGRSDFFWTNRYQQKATVRSLWHEIYRRVNLEIGKGVESFTELVRKDGTVDYGYLLAIRGDPDRQDRPDLMMYVIRDAANAKAKGIEPVSQQAVLEMGQRIARSLRMQGSDAKGASR